MQFSIDEIVTLAIVALATGYLLRRAWGVVMTKRRGGCGSCASCPGQMAGAEPQVLSIDSLLKPVRENHR
jgi:hypothetical protein